MLFYQRLLHPSSTLRFPGPAKHIAIALALALALAIAFALAIALAIALARCACAEYTKPDIPGL